MLVVAVVVDKESREEEIPCKEQPAKFLIHLRYCYWMALKWARHTSSLLHCVLSVCLMKLYSGASLLIFCSNNAGEERFLVFKVLNGSCRICRQVKGGSDKTAKSFARRRLP